MTAALKPLDPAPVKEVRLDTTHKIIEISPGVRFSGWTFGDQVPGPTIRARVGDKIRFTMTNRSDEPVPGVRVTAAPMMHSMDFHAAMVSPQDKYRSIAPGQTIEFEFTSTTPASSCTTVERRWFWSTSPRACTAPSSSNPAPASPPRWTAST